MSFFNSPPDKRKARKKHVCSWCGEIIEKGSFYLRRFCSNDGAGSTIKEHPECAHAENHYYSETDENEWECYFFTRGCICESGDSAHGSNSWCSRIKESIKWNPAEPANTSNHEYANRSLATVRRGPKNGSRLSINCPLASQPSKLVCVLIKARGVRFLLRRNHAKDQPAGA